MKKIKLNKHIKFYRCFTDSLFQHCSYCSERIGKGNLALSISKKCTNPIVTHIHVSCIEAFARDIVKFKEDNLKTLTMEALNYTQEVKK